ncbi:sporulation protein YjcZ [Litchfieldia alkalitelluris]
MSYFYGGAGHGAGYGYGYGYGASAGGGFFENTANSFTLLVVLFISY